MKIYMKRKAHQFEPLFLSDLEKLCKIKENDWVEVSIKKKRNIKFHRKFFALLNMIFENQHYFTTLEDLREWLTIEAGHYKSVRTPRGMTKMAKSISFANMDEHDFNQFYQSFCDAIIREFNFNQKDIEDNILNFM